MSDYITLELFTPSGPQYRRVSTALPRVPTDDEFPTIDLSSIDGDYAARKALAAKIRAVSEGTGFFYIKNHGISEDLIHKALEKGKTFLSQPVEEKEKVLFSHFKHGAGYRGVKSTHVSKAETPDVHEAFAMRYDPRNDPSNKENTDAFASQLVANDEIWKQTSNIPDFKETLVEFWQQRIKLARKLVGIFALALDLPEDYFDAVTTHPGADAAVMHYPGTPATSPEISNLGLGSHTDFQCITLLWQDPLGGLEVLSQDGEWLDVAPVEGTLVVNIGDYLQRLSNDRFKSTVHRVHNRHTTSRYSMPFFLGFNPEAVCSVVPTCIDEDHPALYSPISCGQWIQQRRQMATKGTAY